MIGALRSLAAGRFYKSAGVAVSRPVRDAILAGNAAREEKRWADARDAYARALARQPALPHILLQKGHAQKELGDFVGARSSYKEADALAPRSAEPALHLGHIAKLLGDLHAACHQYVTAFNRDSSSAEAFSELHGVLARGPADLQSEVATALRAIGIRGQDRVDRQARIAQQADGPILIFDVSDLIAYFGHARLPTGIQRVQTETIMHGLAGADLGAVRLCCFIDGREDWLEIDPERFRELARLSVASDDRRDPAWLIALNRLYLELRAAPPLEFPFGSFLVNLGTSWWLRNYFLYVRQAKHRWGIRYIPMVYDLIPAIAPQYCLPDLTQNFIAWLLGVFHHADAYLAISSYTRRDLLKIADDLATPIERDSVHVLPLDADFYRPISPMAAADAIRALGLDGRPFVLFVSTIEVRKGHLAAFDAWAQLIAEFGEAGVPLLVCVGRRGWLNDAVYARLRKDSMLRRHVRMIEGVADETLRALYQQCLFTVYPSDYEGWGLPVTESLCYGKVPIVADSSSLPEAGGPFAIYFPAGSADALARAAATLIADPAARRSREEAISRDFHPKPWTDLVDRIRAVIANWSDQPLDRRPPLAEPDLYYPLTNGSHDQIWPGAGSGEIFRAGLGWWWPDETGCRTRSGGGVLEFRLPNDRPCRISIRLRGLATRTSHWTIAHVEGKEAAHGEIEAQAEVWGSLTITVPPNGVLRLLVMSNETEEGTISLGPSKAVRPIGIAVDGFVVTHTSDEETSQDAAEPAPVFVNAYKRDRANRSLGTNRGIE